MIWTWTKDDKPEQLLERARQTITILEELERSKGWQLFQKDMVEQAEQAVDTVNASRLDPIECLRVLTERGAVKRATSWVTAMLTYMRQVEANLVREVELAVPSNRR